MKRILLSIVEGLFLMILCMGTLAYAADVAQNLSWLKGPEADIQSYQVYYGATEQEVTEKVNAPVITHEGTPDTLADTLTYIYNLQVPDGAETTVYFGVTATDTSNNESEMSNVVSRRYDYLPPARLTLSAD